MVSEQIRLESDVLPRRGHFEGTKFFERLCHEDRLRDLCAMHVANRIVENLHELNLAKLENL